MYPSKRICGNISCQISLKKGKNGGQGWSDNDQKHLILCSVWVDVGRKASPSYGAAKTVHGVPIHVLLHDKI